MSEDSLSTLLEQSISRELKAQLINVSPPSRKYLDYAAFLQDLENRRRYFDAPAPKSYAGALGKKDSLVYTAVKTPPAPGAQLAGEPMDLSSSRRPGFGTRKEQGLCFRCGSKDHRVRDCPLPDNRPAAARGMAKKASQSRSGSRGRERRSRSRRSRRSSRRSGGSSPDSGKGVCLS